MIPDLGPQNKTAEASATMSAMNEILTGRSYAVLGELPKLEVLPIDQLELNAVDLPVKELRRIINLATQRPYGEWRLLTILNADELSEIHQNTLLKTLEEPPRFLTIILRVNSLETFLPTVRSRLHIFHGNATKTSTIGAWPEDEAIILKLLQGAKDRTALKELLKNQLGLWLERVNEYKAGQRLGLLEAAIGRLDRNCNQKLVIDRLLLGWFS